MATFPLVNLWKDRSLVLQLSLLNTSIRYRGSYFGFLWIVLEPLFILSILYVVFSTIRAGSGSEFAVYLLSGIILFQVFARGTQHGLSIFRKNEGILKSLKIKNEIFPVSSTISTSITMIIQVCLFFIIASILNHNFSETLVYFPISLILLFFLILGLCYLLSVLYVYIRDIQPAWGILITALFFISPIFWRLDDVEGILLTVHYFNPFGQIVELAHDSIFGNAISFEDLAFTSIFVIAIFFVGFGIFKKFEKNISQEL